MSGEDDIDSFLGSLTQLSRGMSLQEVLRRHVDGEANSATGNTEAERPRKRGRPATNETTAAAAATSGNRAPPAAVAAAVPAGMAVPAEPPWACPLCTFENAPDADTCGACGVNRQLAWAAWVCAGCSQVNTAVAKPGRQQRCARCRARKEVATPVATVADEGATVPAPVTTVAAPATQPAAGGSSGFAAPPAVAAVEGVAVVDEPGSRRQSGLAERDISPTGQPGGDAVENVGEDADAAGNANRDDEEEEDSASSDEETSSGSDSDSNDSTLSDGTEEGAASGRRRRHPGRAAERAEMRRLFQTLASVDPEKLPLVAPPPALQQRAQLKPFQQQGLGWMLSREAWMMRTATGGPTSPLLANPTAAPPAQAASGTQQLHQQPVATDVAPASCVGGILADEMGLGKTRTVVCLCEMARPPRRRRIDHLWDGRVCSHATLIVCPASVVAQWIAEIRNVVPGNPRVLRFIGPAAKRRTTLDIAGNFDYVITSYGTLGSDFKEEDENACKLNIIQWHRVVLDEAHYIRNRKSLMSRACANLSGERRWALTGTPVQNYLEDLHAILSFLDVPLFRDFAWWRREVDSAGRDGGEPPREAGMQLLQVLLSSIMLRRTHQTKVGGEPILSLPPLTVETRRCQLDADERAVYEAVLNRARAVVDRDEEDHSVAHLISYARAFEMLMRCRQTCLHPFLCANALRRKREERREAAARDRGDGAVRREGDIASSSPRAATMLGLLRGNNSTTTNGEDKAKTELGEAEAAAAAAAAAVAAAADAEEARRRDEERQQRERELMLQEFARAVRRKMQRGNAFAAGTLETIATGGVAEQECVICLGPFSQPALLPCGHVFCAPCLESSLQVSRRCPMCKAPVRPKDVMTVPLAADGEAAGDGADAGSAAAATAKAAPPEPPKPMLADIATVPMEQWPHSCKTLEVLRELRSDPEARFVVFSYFASYIHYLRGVLVGREGFGEGEVDMFHGELSYPRRAAVLANFARPQGPRVLLATIQTCGIGLTLTSAWRVILVEPGWNPGVEAQALKRCHRIGQTRPVRVVRLVTDDSVEEKIAQLAEQKAALANQLTSGGRAAHRLGHREILELFRQRTRPGAPRQASEEHSEGDDDGDDDDRAENARADAAMVQVEARAGRRQRR